MQRAEWPSETEACSLEIEVWCREQRRVWRMMQSVEREVGVEREILCTGGREGGRVR